MPFDLAMRHPFRLGELVVGFAAPDHDLRRRVFQGVIAVPQGALGLGKLAGQEFDAVIFDLDGTLIDSTPAVIRAWTTWAIEYGISREHFERMHGMPSAGIVEQLIPPAQQAAALERVDQLELSDLADVVTLSGAKQALAAVSAGRWAIATSCTTALAQARLGVTGLPIPRVLVTADQVRAGKPAPDAYLLAAERLGVRPERCLAVEDTPNGLAAAAAAGLSRLALVTTTPIDALTADGVVDNLASVEFGVDAAGRIQVSAARQLVPAA